MSRKNNEQQRVYEVEIPTREAIIGALTEAGIPVEDKQLEKLLGTSAEQREGLSRRIGAMEREGQVMRNRRGQILIADKAGLIKGKVIGHPDGFGFLQPESGEDDLFLGPKQMHKAFHGDIVLARVTGVDRRGRSEGSIVEVLERANSKVVGRLFSEHGVHFVLAENKRINQDILVPPDGLKGAKAGQVVVIEIIEQPTKNAEPVGRVIEVLGNYTDPGMEIEIALRKHDLPHEFPNDALAAAKKLPKVVEEKDLKGNRKDLRKLAFVTIDGETARDFDDAVYCERDGKDFRLWVAIADVSHYVKPKDALDREAYERGNSVYFPRRVIPMLPEELSNELCSLKPEVDRCVMVCEMEISAAGAITGYTFYNGVIHSQARLTYTRVAALLEGREPEPAIAKKLHAPINTLYGVFKALLSARAKRGAIDFESQETQMIFDDHGKIEKIVRVERNDAHKLIEECMLAANVCTADYLAKKDQPALYRIHEGPTPEKLEGLRSVLKDFALSLGGGDEPQAKDYAQLLTRIKGKPYTAMLQTVMLRSLRQAVYSPENVGHFGLAYEAYAHFTSPIRRYPDLLVHRGIKAALLGKKYDGGDWNALGVHCSETERRADDATRDVENWLKCYFMQEHVGDEFEGTISGVTNFGLFITLDDLFIDGLVHVSDLGADYYQFDQARHLLKGERTGVRYQLGGHVKVKVVRVDIEAAKIDFTLVVDASALPERGAPSGPPSRSPSKDKGKPKARDIDKKMKKQYGKKHK
ncbi:ribonuclease R [Usitatibacter palustris]|uniref:Ribonuclease R n=1 Tax=Usitatibacter palustris TaxID=2732487 RepID=A0A6M4H7Z2_9PROT|nr:ribonuclease R [Usitatibacter palustris]QJR15690.1 Ribonuclease R [Usitatibacter palustris]